VSCTGHFFSDPPAPNHFSPASSSTYRYDTVQVHERSFIAQLTSKSALQRTIVHFSLKYLVDDVLFEDEQPYELFGAVLKPSAKTPSKLTNCSYYVQTGVAVEDVKNSKSGVSLDEQGFTFIKHRTSFSLSVEHFETAGRGPHNQVVLSYLNETITLVEQYRLAEKVVCIDWRVRSYSAGSALTDTLNL
jgi:hypothetical protein